MEKGKDAKPHIGIFGRRNVGKSSIINVLVKQDIAIVSELAGTTSDPVKKSLEIPGIGPVILIDTAGIDDNSDLGPKRIEKSLKTLQEVDAAILVIAGNVSGAEEKDLIEKFNNLDLPYMIVHNKEDLQPLKNQTIQQIYAMTDVPVLRFSTINPTGLENLINTLKNTIPDLAYRSKSLIGDLVKYGDQVLLITPIDIEAPEGRLILPQIQVIRDILDHDCIAVICKEREIDVQIRNMKPRPSLVITDSQVFQKADASIPKDIPLTSFSILLARQKGDFQNYLKGTPYLNNLKDHDRILILESCAHHVSCDDIGRVKIPRWISNYSGKKLEFDVVAGLDKLPGDIHQYALVIQCGGCMMTLRQISNRLKQAVDARIPVTNYGMAIAWVQGIYARAVAPFTKVMHGVDYL